MKARSAKDREIEIKLPLADANTGKKLLRQAGFRVSKSRIFEVNIVFDTPDRTLMSAGRLLRVRHLKNKGVLTAKGPADDGGKHKSREEIETAVDDPAAMGHILERLGYQQAFRYEKFRTEFARALETGVATLDETPIGAFFELEGPPRWIDRTARSLGFTAAQYITSSYGRLYFEFCQARGIEPSNMVFS
jgi:adenylate cyclase class 2